jgi:two-component system, OmpR family, sensor histidine kinase KdpD
MVPETEDGFAAGVIEASSIDADPERIARELLRTASHDLRSPLTVIQLLVQRLARLRQTAREDRDADWETILSRLTRVADHALALIDDILNADRISPGQDPARTSDPAVDVEDVIAEAITMQQEMLDRAECAVTVSRKSGLERAQGAWNRGCLLRIFCNLFQNASRYAPASPIHVQLARTGDRLRIAFADRGPGLRSGSEIAGKYLDDGVAPTGSHGLGIWIIRRGVAELNGSLRIRNAPGMGLAFAIELPGLQS